MAAAAGALPDVPVPGGTVRQVPVNAIRGWEKRGDKRIKCSASDCQGGVLVNFRLDTSQQQVDELLIGGIVMGRYHPPCSPRNRRFAAPAPAVPAPAPVPQQTEWEKLKGAMRTGYQVITGALRRHPYITAAALTAIAGLAAYTYASAETFQTLCFRDLKDSNVSWCANMPVSANPAHSVYEKFIAVKGWVPSESLHTQRTFQQISEGTKFVYDTFTKFFFNNPFKKFFG